jgi:hypothetical protein
MKKTMLMIVMMMMVLVSASAQRITNMERDADTGDILLYTEAGLVRMPSTSGAHRYRVGEYIGEAQQRIAYTDYRQEARKYELYDGSYYGGYYGGGYYGGGYGGGISLGISTKYGSLGVNVPLGTRNNSYTNTTRSSYTGTRSSGTRSASTTRSSVSGTTRTVNANALRNVW